MRPFSELGEYSIPHRRWDLMTNAVVTLEVYDVTQSREPFSRALGFGEGDDSILHSVERQDLRSRTGRRHGSWIQLARE